MKCNKYIFRHKRLLCFCVRVIVPNVVTRGSSVLTKCGTMFLWEKTHTNSFCYIMLPCGLNLNLFIFQSLLYPDLHFKH